jgi:hypothetical protein
MTEKQACFASPLETGPAPEHVVLVADHPESANSSLESPTAGIELVDRQFLRHSLTEHHLAVLNQRLLDRETTFL